MAVYYYFCIFLSYLVDAGFPIPWKADIIIPVPKLSNVLLDLGDYKRMVNIRLT